MVGDNMSYYDAVKVLSTALRRDIPCVQINLDEIVKSLQSGGIGVDEWKWRTLLAGYSFITMDGGPLIC